MSFGCCLIGYGKLTVDCGESLLNAGHNIYAVQTDSDLVRSWAEINKIPCVASAEDAESIFAQNDFDYLFSIINLHKTSASLLNLPKRCAINFHDGPLPRYAGLHVTSWAIANREKDFGVTWHEMTDVFDAGSILKQKEVIIEPKDTAFSLNVKCFQAGKEAFVALIKELAAGTETRQPQDLSKRTSYLSTKRPDAAAILNWQLDAKTLDCFIDGLSFAPDLNPIGLPKILIKDQYYIVSQAHVASVLTQGPPATISQISAAGIEIVTADGALCISALSTVDGEELDIKHLIDKLGLAVGDSLPELNVLEREKIHSLDHLWGKHEKFWKKRLDALTPFSLTQQFISASSSNISCENIAEDFPNEIHKFLSCELNVSDVADAMAGLYIGFLYRIGGLETFDVGLRHQDVLSLTAGFEHLFPSRVPFEVCINSDDSIKATIAKTAKSFKQHNARGSYCRDLMARTADSNIPELPIAIEILDSIADSVEQASDVLVLSIARDSTQFHWKFNPQKLSAEAFNGIRRAFRAFLSDVQRSIDEPFSGVALVDESQRQHLLIDLNDTKKDYDNNVCVHQLIQRQLAQRADDIALVFRGNEISYRDLDQRSTVVAQQLQRLGAKPDMVIGLCIKRSLEMVIGLLGILKSGAAYVPLDPAYPRDRIALMVEDANASILLTQTSLKEQLPATNGCVLCIDKIPRHLSQEPLIEEVTSKNLAYVIYTSGSTGKPKGVMVEHRNVVNFFSGMDDTLNFTGSPGVWLAVTSISFDISVLEIFWTLSRGFKVILQQEVGVTSVEIGSTVKQKMDVGLFYFSSDAGPSENTNRYKLLMEGAKFADANNFSSVWTPERHFHLFGGLYPNPSVTSAAIAAITSNIAIRAGSIVLPLHNPIRVAEEWSVVDNLSNGRVGFSFASGWHANDFALMPANYEARKQIMYDGIEQICKLWSGDKVEMKNGKNEPFVTRIYPQPVQKLPPIWITTAGNIDSFRQAGEGGFNILTNLLGQSIDDIKEKIAAYREGRRVKGHKGDGIVSVMVHTFVGTDVEEVREIVREPFCSYLKTSFDLVKVAPWAFPAFKQPSKKAAQDPSFDAEALTEEDMDALLEHAFDRYFETAGVFGTPESCIALIDQLKTVGVNEIACLIDFGVDDEVVLDNLQHLAKLRELSNIEFRSAVNDENDDDFSIEAQIYRHKVTHFQCTPSMARILSSDPQNLIALGSVQKVLLGGEALPVDLAESLKAVMQGELINVYGPTETTIWSSSSNISQKNCPITIGRPIANTEIYILDANLQLLPVGVSGELFIGGEGVVRGYLNRSELTAEKFITNPFSQNKNQRIYRTGDLVRYTSNSNIEYLGRLDQQVKLRGYRIELGEIESLINAHAQVKESVVVAAETEQGIQELYAYVVAIKTDLKQSTEHWKTIWNEAYQGNTAIEVGADPGIKDDPTFNISGWLDSYTGEQHQPDHMQEWLDRTCDRILDLKPKRVLEIGCGTGMVLYRIAPQCEAYVGVDFSDSGLSMIAAQLPKQGIKNVTLVQSAADSLSLEGEEPFDLVIINSVCQYFPSAEYFVTVLTKMAQLLSAEGNIFIGDVRSFTLKDMFHTSLELARSPASLTLSELTERIQGHHENELLVDPDFFYNLDQKITAVKHVDIQLKRGLHRNEMSAYRYDVVLRLGVASNTLHDSDFQLLPAVTTLVDLQAAVNSATGNVVIRDITNARLTHDAISQGLLSKNSNIQLVSDLHHKVGNSVVPPRVGIQPEAIYQLDTGYQVQLVWAQSGKKECFDAYFYQAGNGVRLQLEASSTSKPLSELCYEPVQKMGGYEWVDQLKAQLRDKLPEFMVPSEFIRLDAMPLTPNGKINRKALPSPEKRQRATSEAFVAPENDIEKTIADVFQEMLNIEKIGTRDNFFSLGVNSLLIAQANNHLSQRLARKVSLVAMYRFPTIASLAEHLSGQSDSKASSDKGTARAGKRKLAATARRGRRRKS